MKLNDWIFEKVPILSQKWVIYYFAVQYRVEEKYASGPFIMKIVRAFWVTPFMNSNVDSYQK